MGFAVLRAPDTGGHQLRFTILPNDHSHTFRERAYAVGSRLWRSAPASPRGVQIDVHAGGFDPPFVGDTRGYTPPGFLWIQDEAPASEVQVASERLRIRIPRIPGGIDVRLRRTGGCLFSVNCDWRIYASATVSKRGRHPFGKGLSIMF